MTLCLAPRMRKLSSDDFTFAQILGSGTYGVVFHGKNIHNKKEVAIKMYDKHQIIRDRKSKYINREKECLTMLSHVGNGFVKLYSTFQDRHHLYFVMSYARNGELLPYIIKAGSLELNVAQFYAAELLLAMETMHALGIVHRDLKPENLVLNKKMHLEITDFNTAIILKPDYKRESDGADEASSNAGKQIQRRLSLVGTAQYASPELLRRLDGTKASDLWAFGCIIYQMVSGLLPFQDCTEFIIFQKIINVRYDFPAGFPSDAQDLVEKLLLFDYNQRLGANDEGNVYTSIRNHPFFEGINWKTLWSQTPPMDGLAVHYKIPNYLKPGIQNAQMIPYWYVELFKSPKDILNINPYRRAIKLEEQARTNIWHRFVNKELILKQDLVKKNKGLFAKDRMLLLTTGPGLFYVDPTTMTLKGEICWCPELRAKAKSFKRFCVYTSNRKYYFKDPKANAPEWVRFITEVKEAKYPQQST